MIQPCEHCGVSIDTEWPAGLHVCNVPAPVVEQLDADPLAARVADLDRDLDKFAARIAALEDAVEQLRGEPPAPPLGDGDAGGDGDGGAELVP